MKTIKADLGSHFDKIEIVPISDSHIGDDYNEKSLRTTIEYIRVTPNAYTILNGDLINNALKTSVSDIYSAIMQPEAQIEKLIELFTPIKDKILAVLGGNHEARTYKLTGMDVIKNFCYRLGIVDKYSTGNFMLFISFGLPFETRPNRRYTFSLYSTHGASGGKLVNRRYTFSLYSTHGASGGKLVGSKMNALERLSGIVDADIYLHSHTHTPATFKLDYFRSNSRTKTVSQVTKLFVNTNAWLNFGGYGETMGFKPSTVTAVKINLIGSKQKCYATCEI